MQEYKYDELDCSYNEDFVKCPYCGFEDYDVYDGLNFDAETYSCPSCCKDFGITINQHTDFTSFPLESEDSNK